MMPLRQPVHRSLGEGGGFGAQGPLPSVVPLARRRTISAIPCRDLGLLWRDAWPLLERAATRTNGGTKEEVVQTLLRGDAQLWGVFDGDEMIAAVTTQITLIGEKGASSG